MKMGGFIRLSLSEVECIQPAHTKEDKLDYRATLSAQIMQL